MSAETARLLGKAIELLRESGDLQRDGELVAWDMNAKSEKAFKLLDRFEDIHIESLSWEQLDALDAWLTRQGK